MASATDTPEPAFGRLHPKLRESLYRMRWTSLRPIQVEAIHEVFDGRGDLIVAARTAGGKTEAAFLPILSTIVDDPAGGVRAIYAGPLKALINDQFLRLERLCELAEIPVHKWHGDVGQAAKARLLDAPSGVLLITPESIESLFVNHPTHLATIFARLGFVVIDEMHSFLGTERGAQLRSQLARLATKSREPVRRVGLSATLGDPDAARRWLCPREPATVRLIESAEPRSIRLRISGYLRSAPPAKSEEPDPALEDSALEADVFEAFRGKTALIFANNKTKLEECADFARRESDRRGLPNLFRVHHGSLSRGEREDAEDALRSGKPVATFCSSTLEMGIDVGDVESVGQIGAPWSVNSMTQRLGRSGRKEGASSIMRIFVESERLGPDTPILDRLYPELLQAAAMVELMLERWNEPPDVDGLHLSTLIQQILSRIAEAGGARADELLGDLVERGGFANVDRPAFAQVLRGMGSADLIEQSPEGLLILGIKGEKIVRNHDFYVVFSVSEEYRVTHQGRHIGNVSPDPGMTAEGFLILAGRRWRVLEVNTNDKVILVEPSPGGRAARFEGSTGPEIHPRVRQAMRELLTRDNPPAYLDPTASAMLAEARATAREAGLADCSFFQDGPRLYWMTWTGSRIQRTLEGLGRFLGGLNVKDEHIALVFEKAGEDQVRSVYRGLLDQTIDVDVLAARYAVRVREKYEPYLPDALVSRNFARRDLDLAGAMDRIAKL